MEHQNQILQTLRAPESQARLERIVSQEALNNRAAVGRRVCAEFGFVDARGSVQLAGCLKALNTKRICVAGRDGFLEEVLLHEAAHVSLDRLHAMTPAWGAAQEADGGFVSTYARDHPDREDFAESVLPWYAVRRRSERLDAATRTAILEQIPNRLEYFDQQPW